MSGNGHTSRTLRGEPLTILVCLVGLQGNWSIHRVTVNLVWAKALAGLDSDPLIHSPARALFAAQVFLDWSIKYMPQ